MRHAIAFMLIVFGITAPALALDGYPKTSLAEDATATWCPYCPEAYAGLDVVHARYDETEFLSARYYATSGDLGSAKTDAAIAYYGIDGFPTVMINGTERFVGGDDTIASGGPYLGVVDAACLTPSPIRIDLNSFDPTTGTVQATVTMYSETYALEGDHIRFLLLEDDVVDDHTRVTRDIVSDTISLSGAGNSITVDAEFEVDPTWDPNYMHALVFVQRQDQEIIQAVYSHARPTHNVRAMTNSSTLQIGPSSGLYEADWFTVMNTGVDDTFTISAVIDNAPEDWHVTYCDNRGNCYTDPLEFVLQAEESTEFHANVIPGSAGYMTYHFEISSPNLDSPLMVGFTYFTDDLDVLLVDDDGGEDYERYFTEALDAAGRSYGVWNRSASQLTPEVEAAYPLLVWNVGHAFPSLDPSDRELLRRHLDGGGSLFVTGQDIGWDLTSSSDNRDPQFYADYLHADFISDDTNTMDLDGVPGDPITDGLALRIHGGDGAINQYYPSEIAAHDDDATEILYYVGHGAGAIRSVDSDSRARVVYLAFGFEGINNPEDRAALMSAAVTWLLPVGPQHGGTQQHIPSAMTID